VSRRHKQRQLQTRDGSNVGSGTGLPIVAGLYESTAGLPSSREAVENTSRGGGQGDRASRPAAFLDLIEDQIVAPPGSRIPPRARTKERCSRRSA